MQSQLPSFETLRHRVCSSLYRIIKAKQHTATDAILWQELECYGIDGASHQRFDQSVTTFSWNKLKRNTFAMDVMRMHFEVAHLAATWVSDGAVASSDPTATVYERMTIFLKDRPDYKTQCNKLLCMENEPRGNADGNVSVQVPEELLKVQNPDSSAMSTNNRSFSLRHIVDVVNGEISALAPPDFYVAYLRRVNLSNMAATPDTGRRQLKSVFVRNSSGSLKTDETLQRRAAAELASWNDGGGVIGRGGRDDGASAASGGGKRGNDQDGSQENAPLKRQKSEPSSSGTVQEPKTLTTPASDTDLSNFLDMVHAEREFVIGQISRLWTYLETIDQLLDTNFDLNHVNLQQQMSALKEVIQKRNLQKKK